MRIQEGNVKIVMEVQITYQQLRISVQDYEMIPQ